MSPYVAFAIVSLLPMNAHLPHVHRHGEARTVAGKRQIAQLEAAKKAQLRSVLEVLLNEERMYP